MTAREVLLYPNPLLKEVAREADPSSRATASVTRALIETMRSFPGCVGLAAPQIGELLRIVVVDTTGHPKSPDSQGLMVLINPEIVAASGAEVGREGCLSIPDLTANVKRATEIEVRAQGEIFKPASDGTGEPRDLSDRPLTSTAFEARCIQHEIDHLDGILFLDRVESLKDVFQRKHYA